MILNGIFIASAWAQETSAAASAVKPSGLAGLLQSPMFPMLLILPLFYLLMIRPQQKQRSQHAAMIQSLKKGDEIITASGIHAKVHGVSDNIVTIEIADNVRVKIEKSQISSIKTAKPVEGKVLTN